MTAATTTPVGVADGRRLDGLTRGWPRPLLFTSIAAVALGALLAVTLVRQVGGMRAVLAVARPVAAGHVVEADDLRVVQVKPGAGVETIPSADAETVVGRVAAVGLAKGSLLSPAQLREADSRLDGTNAVVGLTLKDGQVPLSLRPGDLVSLVDTGIGAQRATAPAPDAADPILVKAATVFATPTQTATGSVVVSVIVDRAAAARVTIVAAAGRISLVYLAPDAA